MIYVLVLVTYDHYRFQENIAANNTGIFDDELFKHKGWMVLDYGEESRLSEKLEREERCHYWIQKFRVEG